MSRLSVVVLTALTLTVPIGAGPQAGAPEAEPARFVETLSQESIALIETDSQALWAHEHRLRALFHDNFDLSGIGRFALGRHWTGGDSAQRDQYQRLFADYLLSTYVRLLRRHDVRRVAATSVDRLGEGDLVVHSRVELARGAPLHWSWRLRETDGAYRVVDLSSNGLSLAVTFRSEFGSLVANRGLGALIQALRHRTEPELAALGSTTGLLPVVAKLAAPGELLALRMQN